MCCMKLLLLVALCAFPCLEAEKNEYNSIELKSDIIWRQGPMAMYCDGDAPINELMPLIHFKLEFSRTKDEGPGMVEVFVVDEFMEDAQFASISCCEEGNAGAVGCEDGIGSVRSFGDYFTSRYIFETGSSKTVGEHAIPVNKTSVYYLLVANCDESGLGNVFFSGFSEWKNPYGYLPAALYGYLPFYQYMSLIYLGVAAIWFCLNAIFWKELLQLQNCITAVLALCMIEMGTWYFDYLNFNDDGIRHSVPFVIGMLSTVVRRTVSRMLVTAVSMGFGVVKPKLPEKKRIFALGGIYFVFAAIYELFTNLSHTNEIAFFWKLVVVVPVAILDGTFYWWIFMSLSALLVQLKQRRQYAKLQLYQRFSWVLGFSLVCAVLFAIYQMYYLTAHRTNLAFSPLWFLESGFWQGLYSAVLFAIMFLWRPSSNSRRYAYAAQIPTDDEFDDDMFETEMSKTIDTVAERSTVAGGSGQREVDLDDQNFAEGQDDLDRQHSSLFTIDGDEETNFINQTRLG